MIVKGNKLRIPNLSFNPLFKTIKNTLIFSHPLLITSFTFYLVMWFDRLILGVSVTNEALSMYYIATMIIGGFMMIFKVLFEVLSPFVAEIDPLNEHEIKEKFQFLFKWFFHLSILFVIVMFYIVDPLVITAYGESWETSALIMKALLLAFLLRGASNPIRMFLINVFQETKKVATISLLVLVTNVVLSLILIPLFSYWGAVASTITSLAVAWIYMACYIDAIKKMLPFKLIIKSTITISVLILTNLIFVFIDIYNNLILLLISLVLFILLQIIQGEIKKQDLKFCLDVVKANKLQ
jgi:O-antigen/teichoic acid export membrane protein